MPCNLTKNLKPSGLGLMRCRLPVLPQQRMVMPVAHLTCWRWRQALLPVVNNLSSTAQFWQTLHSRMYVDLTREEIFFMSKSQPCTRQFEVLRRMRRYIGLHGCWKEAVILCISQIGRGHVCTPVT